MAGAERGSCEFVRVSPTSWYHVIFPNVSPTGASPDAELRLGLVAVRPNPRLPGILILHTIGDSELSLVYVRRTNY